MDDSERSSGFRPRHLGLGWFATWLVAMIAILSETMWLTTLAGLTMLPIGALLALDIHGVAQKAAAKPQGFGPFRTQHSPAMWRLGGAMVCVMGGFWIFLGLTQSFDEAKALSAVAGVLLPD